MKTYRAPISFGVLCEIVAIETVRETMTVIKVIHTACGFSCGVDSFEQFESEETPTCLHCAITIGGMVAVESAEPEPL